jgi:tetratricopeptide (TPR) repeat protein
VTDDDTSPIQLAADQSLVPAWLALLVLILIIAVVGVGGFVVRGMLSGSAQSSTKLAEIERWTKAVETDPGDATARLNLAYAYQVATQYDRALSEYDKVLELVPNDTAALYNKGVIYMTTGAAKKGEVALWAVLKIDPKHALAAVELGEYYVAQKHYKSLLAAVQPVSDANPTLADLQYLTGLGFEKTGKPDLAKQRYDLALRYSPGMQEALDGLARLGVTPK